MSRFVLSPRAQTDLDDIWDYTAETWGVDQAERYIRLIADSINAVATSPARGQRCDSIREGYRKYPAGSHVLFYRLSGDGIDVVRILHQQMDVERHML